MWWNVIYHCYVNIASGQCIWYWVGGIHMSFGNQKDIGLIWSKYFFYVSGSQQPSSTQQLPQPSFANSSIAEYQLAPSLPTKWEMINPLTYSAKTVPKRTLIKHF